MSSTKAYTAITPRLTPQHKYGRRITYTQRPTVLTGDRQSMNGTYTRTLVLVTPSYHDISIVLRIPRESAQKYDHAPSL